MKHGRKCAYCGSDGPLTREHIFPSFLYQWFPTQTLGFNNKADKFVTTEAQVRDVCSQCNNVVLSRLDAYAKRFFESVDCDTTHSVDRSLDVAYDHELLLKWLMKVSYNAARAQGETPQLLENAVPYLIGRGSAPAIAFLSLEVIRDTPIPDDLREHLPAATRHWDVIPTRMFRAGPAILSTAPPGVTGHCMRFVSVNSWYFTYCLVPSSTPRSTRRRLARLYQTAVPDAALLARDRESARIAVSRRTGLEVYALQGSRVASKWLEYIAESGGRL